MKILLEDPSCPPKLPINFTYQSLMLQLNVLNVFMCLTALNNPYNDHYLNTQGVTHWYHDSSAILIS